MPDRVVVRVPATVANLGPGFDCLGLALAWHNEVVVERADALEITAAGAGADQLPRDASNLIARGVSHAMGDTAVRIHQTLAIPYGRGFGSSAAAIVAGLVAGAGLAGGAIEGRDLVDAAAALEGHADNVGPCLLGGFAIAAGGTVIPLPVTADVRVLACVAPSAFGTDAAREVLPESVPRSDAVQNVARASMLTAALTADRPDLLLSATEDLLHQPARLPLMPDTARVVEGLRGAGVAAFLSGAGPSAAAIVAASRAAAAADVARSLVPGGWEVEIVAIDPDGAHIVEVS